MRIKTIMALLITAGIGWLVVSVPEQIIVALFCAGGIGVVWGCVYIAVELWGPVERDKNVS